MKNCDSSDIVVTGLGVTSAVGQGKENFAKALFEGQHKFSEMKRPGRAGPLTEDRDQHGRKAGQVYLGAEISSLSMPDIVPAHKLRTASLSTRVAIASVHEAWHEAKLDQVDPVRIGLVVGGSNFQQRELVLTHEAYQHRLQFLRPTYGISFMDSDLCGLCSETFGIRGMAYTIGGASASGQVAVIQAAQAVQSGQVDVCIAVGALMDLSYWECQGFRAAGAMGSTRFGNDPAVACRPFDKDHDGFIYGESCGAIVVERQGARSRDGVSPYAQLSGWAMQMDGNRNPNPSFEGEVAVIQKALAQAHLCANEIDYVNPHGTGSIIGDEIELKAIQHSGLNQAYINATKSITGHGLTAAGSTEIVATLLQMREGRLHPTRNLDDPISTAHNWVSDTAISHNVNNALKMSMGFGGMNSAICFQKC